MSERWRGDGEELDLATVTHDDLLLDALGQGTDQPDGDDLGVMLAAWRDDLGAGVDEDAARTPDGDPLLDRLGAGVLPPAAPGVPPAPAPVRQRAVRRRVLRLAAAAVAAVVLTTGLGIGSREAGPSHPLWSLTKVLHPERAQVRVVEDTIDRAREAIAAGRFDDAAQLLDRARRDLVRVGDPAEADRLRAEIDAVQRELSAPGCPGWPQCAPSVPSSPPQAPSAGVPGGGASPAPRATAGKPPAASSPSPAPSPSSGGGIVPPLPGLPLPTASGPSALPSLPGLPLPTVDLPG
ncbi:anti-sigma-D factor RsdA [Micromonospora coxensis]|uniref:Anti-sigma-D factor RsdA to sigma factor binding region n=1 Tax=Micromonospora coxensis TaxID=356852 RepID=A0A1C5H3L3_9ACTN|nr:anti-sigma-D factor RsdA [Micromonospora coxensis]SCG40594.1 Anti-sigma-D factor RsdA to sigma factor binding region [Micromonospora coxensis]